MKLIKCGTAMFVILCFLFSTTAYALDYKYFPDVPDDASYALEINYLSEAGIFTGDEKGNFNPDKSMTRAEAATLMTRLFVRGDLDSLDSENFTDLPSKHWAFSYIESGVKHGIISGYGNGKFGPEDALTYNQAIALLVRALGFEDMVQQVGGWPDGYVTIADELAMTRNTIKIGDNPVSRSTVAILIYNSWEDDGISRTKYAPIDND